MNKRTPVPGYRLLSSPSMKLKLKDNHYETPCIFSKNNNTGCPKKNDTKKLGFLSKTLHHQMA